MTNLLLAAILLYVSNLQKNFLLRAVGRALALGALYFAISSAFYAGTAARLKGLIGEVRANKPGAAEKLSEKLLPKEVSAGRKSIEKTLKEVSDSIK